MSPSIRLDVIKSSCHFWLTLLERVNRVNWLKILFTISRVRLWRNVCHIVAADLAQSPFWMDTWQTRLKRRTKNSKNRSTHSLISETNVGLSPKRCSITTSRRKRWEDTEHPFHMQSTHSYFAFPADPECVTRFHCRPSVLFVAQNICKFVCILWIRGRFFRLSLQTKICSDLRLPYTFQRPFAALFGSNQIRSHSDNFERQI